MTTISVTLLDTTTISISFAYNPCIIEKLKRVTDSRKWDPANKRWTCHASELPKLKENFSCMIDAEVEKLWNDLYSSKAPDIGLDLDGFKGKLYDFQTDGVRFLTAKQHCMLADEIGTGKTIQTLAFLTHLSNTISEKGNTLIICPNSIKWQWFNETKKFTELRPYIIDGTLAERRLMYQNPSDFGDIGLINYEKFSREGELIAASSYQTLVLDEAQRIKSGKALCTKAIKKLRAARRICLTGTPMQNRPIELYNIFQFIFPNFLGNFYVFRNNYFIMGGYKDKEVIAYKNLDRLHKSIQPIFLRRKKEDVQLQLPEKIITDRWIELSPEERKMYDGLKDAAMEKLQNPDADMSCVLAQISYLRSFCGFPALVVTDAPKKSTKLEELVNTVKDILASGEHKILVFSQYKRLVDVISTELTREKIGNCVFHGEMTTEERDDTIKRFTTEVTLPVMVLTDAGSTGLNLQVADFVINYEQHFNPAMVEQRIGRAYRIGQKNTVNVINFHTKNTIEENIYKLIQNKKDLFDKIVEGKTNINTIDEIKKLVTGG